MREQVAIVKHVCLLFSSTTGFEDNFVKLDSRFVTTQGVAYDYGSIMHYDAYAFSNNGQPTIRPKQPGVPLQNLGQREGLSSTDIEHVRALYCSDGKNLLLSNFPSLSLTLSLSLSLSFSFFLSLFLSLSFSPSLSFSLSLCFFLSLSLYCLSLFSLFLITRICPIV